jgi:hypothetical protein
MRTDLMDSGESEFAYEEFVKARKSHWMEEARTLGSEIEVPSSERIQLGEDESNFMISAKGPDNLHGVFEDSAETGWFYIYDSLSKCVLKATHVYNRRDVDVESEDVDVCWSTGGDVCCIAVWGQIRAFLGVKREIEMRKPITNTDADGFYASEWPEGFAHLLKTTDEK